MCISCNGQRVHAFTRNKESKSGGSTLQWGVVTLQPLLLPLSLLSGFGACAHVPDLFFKPRGQGFEVWSAMWDLTPLTPRYGNSPENYFEEHSYKSMSNMIRR